MLRALVILIACQLHRARVVISIDVGTESTRAAVFDGSGNNLGSFASPHVTSHPAAGWAEQQPEDWWDGLSFAVRGALAESGCSAEDVAALCMATTSCTVVACDSAGVPLRPALLWMDARSAPQAAEILEKGKGDRALAVNCGGDGPISAEWMLCKALWLRQSEPETWERAAIICECQDWLQFRCTGRLCAGGCNVATRWHCDGVRACSENDEHTGAFGGRPDTLLERVGLEGLGSKWPAECVAMGALQGRLTEEAAAHLGLLPGTPLAQGGADAFVGLVGLGAATTPRAVGLVTGSSHLHLALVDAEAPRTARGVWGSYSGAPLSSNAMAEGGQSSTGAALQWVRRLISSGGETPPSLAALDAEAAAVGIGCEGVCMLETFQGSRTPTTDPLARAAIVGLTLHHTRAHVWRACLEAVCLGTRAAIEGLCGVTGEAPAVMLAAGGATRSPMWLQMHADACGLPVTVGESADAPLLGGAVLAAALPGSLHGDSGPPRGLSPPAGSAGVPESAQVTADGEMAKGERPHAAALSPHAAIARAVERMVRTSQTVEPQPNAVAAFDALYRSRYAHIAPALAPLSQRASVPASPLPRALRPPPARLTLPSSRRPAVVQPSVLAADIGALSAAALEVAQSGAGWVHVDVNDGSAICQHSLSSLGPASIAAVHAAAPSLRIDVHLYTMEPEAHVRSVAAAGADRITFQWESLLDPPDEQASPADGAPEQQQALRRAEALAESIRAAGCGVGVCIAPDTPAEAILPLCQARLVEQVNVLSVLPGIGGQAFRESVLEKVRTLRAAHPELPFLLVDGGIDAATAPLAAAAGANALVSGSYLFRAPPGRMAERLDVLERALVEHGE